MTTRGFLIWDFEGTLATRPSNWAGALCEVVASQYPDLRVTPDRLGLSHLLIDVYCSGRTGAEKPHPKAFEAVFTDHPEACAGWMIGDSWRADV